MLDIRLRRTALLSVLTLMLAACGGETSDTTTAAAPPSDARVAALRARLDDVREEARHSLDAQAIKRLQRAFGYYMDEMLIDEVVALFAEDAEWEFARDGVYVGRDRIRDYLLAMNDGRAGLREGQLNEYLQLMPAITIAEDGQSAKARWRAIMLLGEYGEQALWGEGPYENEYVKEGGVWKISRLHWHQTILVPYEGGWGRNEDFNQGKWVSDTLPPDAPSTYDAGYWPTTFLPPFSFPNPVGRYEGTMAQGGDQ